MSHAGAGTGEHILRVSAGLVKKYHTRDPFAIAGELGFIINKRNDFKRQRGSFAVVLGNVFLFINANQSDEMQRMVCAHELGHALLHRELVTASPWILEHELFDIRSSAEYEANLFAAEMLIDETEMRKLLQEGYDVLQTARAMRINVNLLLLKLAAMEEFMKKSLPYLPDSRFLTQPPEKQADKGAGVLSAGDP